MVAMETVASFLSFPFLLFTVPGADQIIYRSMQQDHDYDYLRGVWLCYWLDWAKYMVTSEVSWCLYSIAAAPVRHLLWMLRQSAMSIMQRGFRGVWDIAMRIYERQGKRALVINGELEAGQGERAPEPAAPEPAAPKPEAEWWQGITVYEHWAWRCARCQGLQFGWCDRQMSYYCLLCESIDNENLAV